MERTVSPYSNRNLRIGFFVDGANIHQSCKHRFGVGPDYSRLLKLAVDSNQLVRAFLYAVNHDPVKMVSWSASMRSIGYDVKDKIPRKIGDRSKADWDIGICVDIIRMLDAIDIVVIASGDGDFEPLIRYCQSRGKIVRVISAQGSTAAIMKDLSDEHIEITREYLMHELHNRESA